MQVKVLTFNPFQENTYIIYDETRECIIIDPGCYEEKEEIQLRSFIDENMLTPRNSIGFSALQCLVKNSLLIIVKQL